MNHQDPIVWKEVTSVYVTPSRVFFIGPYAIYERRRHEAREIPYNVHLERSEVTR